MDPLSQSNFQMDDHVFRLISDLIYEHSGLRYESTSRYLIQKRLSQRLQQLNLDSFEKYYYYLLYHPDRENEMESIFDLITTNETYFFREDRQLRAFSEEILPQLMQQRKDSRTLSIWSAGCSTGEEPYTIAILCSQNRELADWHVDIFASDISHKVIQQARRAVYSDSSFRCTEEITRLRFFDKVEDGKWKVKDPIRQMVTFGKMNLLDEQKIGVFGELDIIFCRNVIIYFDLEAKKRVIENFYRKLRRDGYLLLGHAESLLSLSTKFKLRHLKNDMVYQK